jgi:hypothetical protein
MSGFGRDDDVGHLFEDSGSANHDSAATQLIVDRVLPLLAEIDAGCCASVRADSSLRATSEGARGTLAIIRSGGVSRPEWPDSPDFAACFVSIGATVMSAFDVARAGGRRPTG